MRAFINTFAYAAVVVASFLVAGCSGDDGKREDTREPVGAGSIVKSYISNYIRPAGLSIRESYIGIIRLDIEADYFTREQYYELSEKYNDTSYYRNQSIPVEALYDGIDSLSMETVDYFDEAHPAGSDISDIVYCKYVTYYEFIQSGYANCGLYQNDCPPVNYDWVGAFPHEMWLSEVNYENSQLMTNEMIIEFPVEPETPGVYSFIFRFNMPEIELETTFEYEFQ